MSKAVTKDIEFPSIGTIGDNRNHTEDMVFINKYQNKDIPEYLCWYYNIRANNYKFIGNSTGFYGVEHYTPSVFLSKIKRCFRAQFVDAARGFYLMLGNTIIPDGGFYLSILVPVKLLPERFLFCKVTLVPNLKQNRLEDFVIVITPIERYVRSNISIFLLNNGNVHNGLTSLLKTHLKPPGVTLTQKQQLVLSALHRGLYAIEIAEQLGVVVNSVYKINRRLIEKMSDFFELDFKEAREAADYYYNSFS